jgi:hypothetical protein
MASREKPGAITYSDILSSSAKMPTPTPSHPKKRIETPAMQPKSSAIQAEHAIEPTS